MYNGMVKRKQWHYCLFILFVITFTSCSNYSSVVKQNLGQTTKLLIQAPNISDAYDGDKTIRFNIEHSDAMNKYGEIEKEKTLILPLLIWNYWDHISKHTIGEDQIDGDVYRYIQSAFEQSATRKGYKLVDKEEDILVTIKPQKIESSTKYEKSGYFYFILFAYGYGMSERKGPYASNVKFEVETKIGNRTYGNEIVGKSYLVQNDFDIEENELGRVARALEYSVNDAAKKYVETLPK